MQGGLGVHKREMTALLAQEITKHPWAFKCDQPHCFYSVCADSEQAAEQIKSEHPCPYAGGESHYSWSVTVTLVEQVWEKLDAEMDNLMKTPSGHANTIAIKARLRAFAEVLAIFMTPHFTSADDIAREAGRRYKNRDDETYETAGLKSRRFEAPPSLQSKAQGWSHAGTGYTSQPEQASSPEMKRQTPGSRAKQPGVGSTVAHKLNETEVASVKLFASNGFTPEQLAKAHGVSVAVINGILTS